MFDLKSIYGSKIQRQIHSFDYYIRRYIYDTQSSELGLNVHNSSILVAEHYVRVSQVTKDIDYDLAIASDYIVKDQIELIKNRKATIGWLLDDLLIMEWDE